MHSSLKLQDSSHNAAAICTMTSSSSEPADITAQQALLFDLKSSNALQPAVQGPILRPSRFSLAYLIRLQLDRNFR